ncbi:fungal-specific transcription factor domain-containing protein [Mycena filopes]|nr:fungal-specific transcription factor domain-containing protein [Mycena filopes]
MADQDHPAESTPNSSSKLPVQSKQRRQERACDFCRRRRSRCDGLNMPERPCSNCLAFGSSCTFLLPAKNRGHKNVIVEELQKTNASLKKENESLRLENTALKARLLRCGSCQDGNPGGIASAFRSSTSESVPSLSIATPPPDERDATEGLSTRFGQFSLRSMKNRYSNSAGCWSLAKNAMAMKEKYFGQPLESRVRRPVYWHILPWEEEEAYAQDQIHYVYPPKDLLNSLVDLYFANIHPNIPLLHRPSFEQSVSEGLHLNDVEFGGLLLSVLALASRYSDDPRVFVGDDLNASLSAGSKFFAQVQARRFVVEPTMYGVQMYCLLSLFAIGTSFPQAAGGYLAIGMYFLQIHREYRRKRDTGGLKFEDELWKKIFWSYIFLERMSCVFQGRPTALPIEEYDIDLPLDVDDEYWDRGFIQPLGKPSTISSFVYQSQLSEILGDTMHRLYGSPKTKITLGWTGPEWEQRTVAELDSAMNDFYGSIPPNLRWSSDDPPYGPFFNQAATLRINYHLVQIMIHRPFIHTSSILTAPSLSICTRAARTIIQTADIGWLKTMHREPLPNVMNAVFISGVLLVVNALGARRPGTPADLAKDAQHVETALEILKFWEPRWQVVGRLWEVLRELSSLNPPKYQPDVSSGSYDPNASLPNPVPHGLLPQPQQHVESTSTSTREAAFDFRPGMSIEQLLADTTNSLDSILDTDFMMSMWIDPDANTDGAHWETNLVG